MTRIDASKTIERSIRINPATREKTVPSLLVVLLDETHRQTGRPTDLKWDTIGVNCGPVVPVEHLQPLKSY